MKTSPRDLKAGDAVIIKPSKYNWDNTRGTAFVLRVDNPECILVQCGSVEIWLTWRRLEGIEVLP